MVLLMSPATKRQARQQVCDITRRHISLTDTQEAGTHAFLSSGMGVSIRKHGVTPNKILISKNPSMLIICKLCGDNSYCLQSSSSCQYEYHEASPVGPTWTAIPWFFASQKLRLILSKVLCVFLHLTQSQSYYTTGGLPSSVRLKAKPLETPHQYFLFFFFKWIHAIIVLM
jgi:hypothetical protein